MKIPVVVLSIPGLRDRDLSQLPVLADHAARGSKSRIRHQFPCVTWPSQCNVLTGTTAREHGVIANGFYWRDRDEVEMWTAWNEVIQQPQIWDVIGQQHPELRTAAWFPMLAKGCHADYVCMPAPIHQPDGSEEMWCHTKPQEFYGELLEQFGHFPLHHFWGPLAGIQSSQWIVDSAIVTAERFRPDFWYIYLPHLDYAAQKFGPDSAEAGNALKELNGVLEKLTDQFQSIYPPSPVWLSISEYVITDVDHVSYPNRLLRENDLLRCREENGKEQLDFELSEAWALVDHQFSHVFVKNRDPAVIEQIVDLFIGQTGVDQVAVGSGRKALNLDHDRSGDVIVVSSRNSWQAYYWWDDDSRAPDFARTVDIHRKPGYDPVELFVDPATRSIPLDATLVRGSHGAPPIDESMQGAIVCSQPGRLTEQSIEDTAIQSLILKMLFE